MQKTFVAFVLIAILLAACVPSTSTDVTQTPSVAITEKPSVTQLPTLAVSSLNVEKEALRGAQVTVWHPWFGAEASLFESQIQQFNTTNEWGIVVNAESKNNFSEVVAQTDAALKESKNPNVVIALPEHAIGWQENVVDLNTYLRDPIYGMSALEMSDFPSVIWMQDELDDLRLGMPAQRTARFVLYNQSWARELGFDSPPQTFSDFQSQACAAHNALASDANADNDALGGWLIDTNATTTLSWMLAFGGSVQEEKGYRFLTPKNVDAFKSLKLLQQKGCAWVASPDSSVYDRFAGRQALFATASLEEFVDQARSFGALGSKDEWIALPFPGTDQTAFVVYGSSFIVFNSDDVTQLASWLFIRWMLSAENQAKWVQSTDLFPLRSSTMDLLTDYSASHPQWAEAVAFLPTGKMTPKLSSWRNVKVMMEDAVRDMFDTIRHPELTDGQAPIILKQMEDTARDLNR
ncbi:MAG: extracellular solute-binding protein [Anaerolineales bacterium]|nr:extracellular solute-binding protein [Anaerolineales bacterium]